MKVALVHDWLNGMRGGEKVLEVLCELYPSADIFTLLLEREKISPRIGGMRIRTSFIQQLPFASTKYRNYLPLFPRAVESFDLRGYELIVSTSHAVAKGARAPSSSFNLCYCFTPMRYAWFFYEEYFGRSHFKKTLARPIFAYLKRWDVASSRRVDRFFAISKNVARRIDRIYNRKAEVIYPPVEAEFFVPLEPAEDLSGQRAVSAGGQKYLRRDGPAGGDYFLLVSALVPYKRVDLAVAAFNRLGLPLKIIGTGPLARRLKAGAGENISFLGWQSDEALRSYYQHCRALIFPGVEDFGIVPLEAMACGRPVIGLGRGGLVESVVPWRGSGNASPTGVFFSDQTDGSLIEAVEFFLEREGGFNKKAIREHVLKFDRGVFKKRIKEAIERSIEEISAGK